MKIVFAVLTLLFGAFTYFQRNDPDAFWWMLFYGEITILFGMATAGKIIRPLVGRIGILSILLALFFLPGAFEFLTNQDGVAFSQGMSNDYGYIEEAREFGGLLIVILALVGLWRYQPPKTA